VIYLDTGCLAKLYYPEPESQKVAALVAGQPICFNPLHELEFTNALHLKLFHRGATPAQVQAAAALVEADIKSGVLLPSVANWEKIFRAATDLARQHSAAFGCRSLDVLHCGGPGSGSGRVSQHRRQTEAVGGCDGAEIGDFLMPVEQASARRLCLATS
jgi:hypothetical protein